MNTHIEVITPSLAAHYLNANVSNRKLRRTAVDYLAGCIDRDEFQTTHQGIAFSSDGELLDGQHRLNAIIKADKPVKMMVTNGLDPELFKVTDVGLKRTYGDITGLSIEQAAICRFIFKIAAGKPRPSADEIIEIESKLSHHITPFLNKKRVTQLSQAPFAVGAIVQLLNGQSVDYVTEMYDNLIHYRYERMNNLSAALSRLASHEVGRKTKPSEYMVMSRAIHCFDASRQHVSRVTITERMANNYTAKAKATLRNALGFNNSIGE